MLWLFKGIWSYRAEIILAAQFLNALRKTAREVTRDYIRKKVQTKLKESLLVVSLQIGLLIFALALTASYPRLSTRLFASVVLWLLTLFNLFQLVFITIPEIRSLHRMLRGKVGYALKYLLEISLVTELMRLDIVFLAICLITGISSRTMLGTYFSYTKPWIQLTLPSPTDSNGRHHPRRRSP